MNIKKRKIGFLLLLVIVAGVVGVTVYGTYSFYSSSSEVQNQIISIGDSTVLLKEIFNKDDLWVPGETKQKEVHFGNQSSVDQVIRFRAVGIWYDNKGTPQDLTDDTVWNPSGTYSPEPVVINWTSEITNGTWIKVGDWYYYTKVLKAGTVNSPTLTPNVMSSVTFSPAISNNNPGAQDDFSDKRYSLTIEMETLDVITAMSAQAWGMNFSKSGNTLTWSIAP